MSNQQQPKVTKRNSPSTTKYNYIQTEPDEVEPGNIEEDYRDANSSIDKQFVGISISDSNFNDENKHQIPKIQQIKHKKNIIKTLPEQGALKKKKSNQQIKTKVTKFYIEEQQKKQPKLQQYKVPNNIKQNTAVKTQRVKQNSLVKKFIDLNNSQETFPDYEGQKSIYDQALLSMQKSPQKMKGLMKPLPLKNLIKTQGLNSDRDRPGKPVVFSFNLHGQARNTSANNSDNKYDSPNKAGSIDSEMDEQNSDVVVNKIKTQSIDKNKFMHPIQTEESKQNSSTKKQKVLSSFQQVGNSQKVSPQKAISPQKFKSKAQKPTKPQKPNSNNIGQLHHSKSNSLSMTQSLKVIPKTTKAPSKKVENKKFVQFQQTKTTLAEKKSKFGSAMKFENEPEDKNSFKIAKQRLDARPISPRGPNNQQKSVKNDSGNNQDRVFPFSGEEKSFVDSHVAQALTQRFSLGYNDLETMKSKNQIIKSPQNMRTPSINQKHVNMVVEQSFASLPKKIVLPLKQTTGIMFQRPSGASESRLTNQSSRRDRSQTHHLPSSFNAGELQPEAKTHRLDKQVKFQEHEDKNLQRANYSVTSAGMRSNENASQAVRELSNLKNLRDQKKNSKSLLKYGIISNQSDAGDAIALGQKMNEIQNQLSELSAHEKSNYGSRRRLRSNSFHRRQGHSTSQRSLADYQPNLQNQSASALPISKNFTIETPQPSGSRFTARLPSKNAFVLYSQNVQEPINTFNSTTKKVMIDLSSNPQIDVTRNFNLNLIHSNEVEEDIEQQSLQFVDSFQGSSNMFKKQAPRNVHTALQQPSMMQGGYSSYHQQPAPQSQARQSSKSGKRQLIKHDSMTEKLSRELLVNSGAQPPRQNQYISAFVQPTMESNTHMKSEKSLGRGSSSQTRRGNLLFQKKNAAGVNFKQVQNEFD